MSNKTLVLLTLLPLIAGAASCGSSVPPLAGDSRGDAPAAAASEPNGIWLAGDLHVHTDHSYDGSFPRQQADDKAGGNVAVSDQIATAESRGLLFLPLTDHYTYSQHYDPLWESSRTLLIPGEEAGTPHHTVHGAVDTMVQGDRVPDAPEYAHIQQTLWDTHAQNALFVVAHPDGSFQDLDRNPTDFANLVGMDLVETWNKVQAPDNEIDYAENRWNAGFRFGVAGASDNHWRESWPVQGPGMPTTRVLAATLNERAVLSGLQRGRTTLSSGVGTGGPLLTLELDLGADGVVDAVGGDEAYAPAGSAARLRLRALHAPGTTVYLFKSPGRAAGPLQTYVPASDDETWALDVTVEDSPTWYRLEARGPGESAGTLPSVYTDPAANAPESDENQLRGMTAPVFLSNAPVEPAAESPVPPDQGADDGAQLVIGEPGAFAGFPDLARGAGVTHVVAEVHGDGRTRLHYRRIPDAGGAGPAVDLAPLSDSARFPKIAVQGERVWVVWQDERAGQIPRRPAVYLRHSSDGGRNWEPETVVRAIPGRAERPDIAATAAGLPLLVWQEIRGSEPFDVMAQVIGRDAEPVNVSRADKAFGPGDPADTRSARYPASIWPSAAAGPDGRLYVAFQDNRTDPDPLWTGQAATGPGTDPDNWQILVCARGPNDAGWGAPVALGADERSDRHPSLALAGDGALVVAWDSRELKRAGANLAVLAAVSRDGGASFSAPQAPAPADSAMSQYPRLGVDANGRVRAVWYDSRSADWRWRIMSAVFDGANWVPTLVPSRGINTWPASDGGAIAFASTRNAQRLQRDRTQQIFLLAAP